MPVAPISLRWWLLPLVLFAASAPLWLHRFEPATFVYLNALCAGVAAPVWTGLSLLGNAWGVLGVTAPLLVLAPRLMWAWLCAAPFAIVFARVGKGLIVSPRPAAEVDNAQMRIVGEALHNVSMPSGHTLTAFAVASAIYFALPLTGRTRHVWLFALAAAAGLSRIAVGAHWPGDVAVGASLGLLAGMLGVQLLARMDVKHLQPTAWSLRLVALLLGVTAFTLWTEAQDFDENQPVQYLLAVLVVVSLGFFGKQNLASKR
ncbi:MAG TPA: phosphatase PAP2 family protein [Rhodoferax sp.]|jgi:membrane-associated phospholipid phosphatase|nr:phosphatase PAP2 family protein [Rhodoferax sp.]HNV58203.1 phosphatase PAP2 family protein [Rhodoferax sp.]